MKARQLIDLLDQFDGEMDVVVEARVVPDEEGDLEIGDGDLLTIQDERSIYRALNVIRIIADKEWD